MGTANNKSETINNGIKSKVSEPIDLIIWFDKNIQSKGNQEYLNYIKLYFVEQKVYTFSDLAELKKFIYFIEEDKKVLLISSGSSGEDLLHGVYQSQKISKVVIFCFNVKKYTQMAAQYNKVVAVESELKNLLNTLVEHVQTNTKLSEDLDVAFHFTDEEAFVDFENLNFVLQLAQNEEKINSKQAEKDFVIFAKAYLLQQKSALQEKKKMLEDFKQFVNDIKNDNNEVVYWYTKVSFVNKLVNKILRKGDLVEIYQIRHFICLLIKSVKKNLSQGGEESVKMKPSVLYRGTRLKKDEIKVWEENAGKPMLVNGFISTSEDISIASKFTNRRKENCEPVLIEINLPEDHKDLIYPIFLQSHFGEEKEYLLGINTFFIVNSIKPIYSNDKLDYYHIAVTIINIDKFYSFYKERTQPQLCINPHNHILLKNYNLDIFYMADLFSHSKHKNKLFDLFLNFDNIQTKDLNDRALYYTFLAEYYQHQEDYEKSLELFNNCLKIYESIDADNEDQIRTIKETIQEIEDKRTRKLKLSNEEI